ncbi:hypothetical protein V6N11_071549 [Hibiscus sabdariffa]|uniref:Uncharacterized protein n=1 Tax=Hibiscus sabdariffa TaxID=183260 RepID=A0ABR2U0N8_9ROSI
MGSLEWIQLNFFSSSHFVIVPTDWDLYFGAILWSLWLRRNAMIFDLDNLAMHSVSDRSRWLWAEMRAACALEGNTRSGQASTDGLLPVSRANAHWVSPPMDWVKLDVTPSTRPSPRPHPRWSHGEYRSQTRRSNSDKQP